MSVMYHSESPVIENPERKALLMVLEKSWIGLMENYTLYEPTSLKTGNNAIGNLTGLNWWISCKNIELKL